ncbi:MAG: helix-turn-helix transcriptional regulator [Afipia sp.]|nr:helix-turn-helix transcriptional regulator [Afipia sp.]
MGIPTSVLRRAREEAGLKQNDVALRLGVSGSVISRLEKADVTTDDVMAHRYLEALGTSIGSEIAAFYSRDWRLSDRPSFFHPDREALWSGEQALQRLEDFATSEDYDPLLDVPITKIKSGLETAIAFVGRLDHSMAWIGSVGVGKTTALSLLTNLVVEGKGGIRQPVFPATGGRTTISEVVVRAAPAYGIAVEPMSEDAVRLLVADLVNGLAKNEGGVSTELERAIRNMADLRRSRDEKRGNVDPIRDLLDQKKNAVDDVIEEVIVRMNLNDRTETQLILSESTENGLRWLSENITTINYGQHQRFSLPERVTVFVPPSFLRKMRYDVTIVDTKGIHGTTLRQDLRAHLDDARTLSILCCMFNEAPGAEALKMLGELKSLGSDALDRQRIVILVLPRGDEAMKIIDESGEQPETAEDGYAIRALQVADTFRKEGLPDVPVVFFNAMTDMPSVVWDQLGGRIGVLRQRQLDRLSRFVDVSADLVTNADAAKIQQARVALAEEVVRMCEAYGRLQPLVRPAHQTLLDEIGKGHASSIAASVNRRGEWSNFSVMHIIGLGVRVDANFRTHEVFTKIDGRLEGLSQKFSSLPEAVTILESLREDLEEWRQEFLLQAVTIGRVAFKPYLDSASDLWKGLAAYWGQGSGYRSKVLADISRWFEETEEVGEARRRVETRLREAWRGLVINRLKAATEVETTEATN